MNIMPGLKYQSAPEHALKWFEFSKCALLNMQSCIASSPGYLCVTMKNWEWPGDEATYFTQ